MCEPNTIAFTLGVMQRQQASEAENRYEMLAYGQRKEAAFQAFAALRDRELQERQKAAQDIRQIREQAQAAQGAARLSALEAGVRGASVEHLLRSFEGGELTSVGIANTNLADTAKQLREQAKAAANIQAPRRTEGPLDSPMGLASSALGIAVAGL